MTPVLSMASDLDPNSPGDEGLMGGRPPSAVFLWPYPFAGNFNGGGHTIRNLVIRAGSQSDWRLTSADCFGRIGSGGVVRDLKIEAADVQVVHRRAGILAGENAGQVVNCQVSGRVSSNFALFFVDEVGGLVGRNTGDITDCRADTDLVWGYQCVGGLVGSNFSEGKIVGCRAALARGVATKHAPADWSASIPARSVGSYALGGILGSDSSFMYGGLAGANTGTILDCHAGSNIAAGARCSQLGGLAGANRVQSSIVTPAAVSARRVNAMSSAVWSEGVYPRAPW